MRNLQRLTVLSCLLTAFITILNTPAPAEIAAKRVLILPLTIHSEKDLTFLNKGIMDMLAARISQSATVIRKSELTPGKEPLQMGRDLDADFVVTGSLTIFGKSVSTDAALIAVDTGETALQFSRFGQNSSDALMHINQFGTQAGQHLASLSSAPRSAQPADAAPAVMIPQPAAPVKPVRPASTPTPPATAPKSAPAAATAATTAAAAASATRTSPPPQPAPAVSEAVAIDSADEALWTSNPFEGTIRALTTGDINGDGRSDIVFAHDNQIVVVHRRGNRLERIAEVDAGKRHTIIAVDAGDINGNGRAEIFVTRLNAQKRLDSIVLEWNGSTLETLVDDQRWYFRVGNDPENGTLLMGQRPGSPSANDTGGLFEDNHFLPGVVELTWTGKGFNAGRRFVLPSDMTLYRFARGDLFNDGKIRTIAYSASDKLRIYDPAGSLQWAGRETLGGNPLYLETTSATDARTTDHTYLTQRLKIVDLDGDGTTEVVTVHNRDLARGLAERFRKYSHGRIVVLNWNKVNMRQVWTGEEIGGYISDFSLADINGDGRLEAVYAMVVSTGLAQTKSSSIVVEPIGSLSE